ncbi:hypothetical protein GmRootV59_27730 [Variovorax sp. V59]|jgi:Domain of unknown function (DUF4149)|uniref:TMEM205-like domain-containing protein n=2 Tax=Variovorax TaxID=34072 RepID=A0AAE3Y4W8_VARPD|nr:MULTISPECIES: DUF4149 domain-containing protein [Variovorax]MBD9665131.1 DUF4149 domain-containing protein [Variovorax sp. VRV01]MDP9967193.1 hypothetical protein [Variovorax paradoxus]MDR6429398.1 hypothetical protein [Variovorax paradoxus]MDR6455392.1 hypothetical protein [Variovorax paradoxus]TWD76744.1 uncharacterized protein DUF4149 [Variovorax beijingensis]
MKDRLALMLAAFWWGSLTTIGFLVVPMLFAKLGSPAVAGNFAGQLFEAQSWIAIGCGLLLLVHFRTKMDQRIDSASMSAIFLILGALLLALLQQYAVAPRILARDNLKLWHAVGSGMYVVQWLCAGALLWRMGGRAPAAA